MAVKLGNGNWAVKEDKLLAYNDNSGLFFNKEFDFSRGTSATYVAKDGLIKTAGIQPNIVNNGDFSELGSELVTNGDFTDWTADNPDGWTVLNEDANNYVTQDGTYARIVSNDTASIQIKQTIFTIGKTYKVELDAVVNSGNVEGLKLNDATAPATIGYVNSTGHHTFYFKAAGTAFVINRKGGGDTDILIDNVSVKEVAQNWTVTNEDANNYVEFDQDEGTVRLKFLNTSPLTTLSSDTQYLSGKTYKLIVDVKEVVSGSIKVDAAGVTETFNSVGIQQRIIEPTGNATINFYRATANVDITLNSVSLQEIQTDTPRIDFTNDTKGHLLLEPSRTNLLERSNEFDNSYWGKQNVTVTANSAISPDGTNNAFLLDVGTADDDHSLRKTNVTPTATYAVSIFAKKGSTDYVWFVCGGSSRGVQAIFDLSDGSVTDSGTVGSGQTLVAAKSVDMGNGWYRLIMEAETTSAPTNNLTITPYYQDTFSGNITTSWQGNNETIYIYGAMNEEGSFATSYIPTTGATATRNADVCNNSGSAQDFNSEEGVVYAEIAALIETAGATKQFTVSGSTTDNQIKFTFKNTANQVNFSLKSNGSTEVNLLHTISPVITNFFKIAFKYKVNDCALWVNGTEVATDTSAAMPLDLSSLQFDRGDGGNDFNGKIRNLQVFTEALTDEQLEKLTS